MAENRVAQQQKWVRAMESHIYKAHDYRIHQLEEINAKLEKLDGTTCTGEVNWRDKGSKSPKMIILHGTGKSCPIHGTPVDKKRLRPYIGTKSAEQDAARKAIADHVRLTDLQSRRDSLSRAITRAEAALQEFYLQLGHTCPEIGQATTPAPIRDWTPQTSYRRW